MKTVVCWPVCPIYLSDLLEAQRARLGAHHLGQQDERAADEGRTLLPAHLQQALRERLKTQGVHALDLSDQTPKEKATTTTGLAHLHSSVRDVFLHAFEEQVEKHGLFGRRLECRVEQLLVQGHVVAIRGALAESGQHHTQQVANATTSNVLRWASFFTNETPFGSEFSLQEDTSKTSIRYLESMTWKSSMSAWTAVLNCTTCRTRYNVFICCSSSPLSTEVISTVCCVKTKPRTAQDRGNLDLGHEAKTESRASYSPQEIERKQSGKNSSMELAVI